jgi:hypothetical protein
MSRYQVETEKTTTIRFGHTVVGVTAVRLTALTITLKRGVLLRAPGPNDPTPNSAAIWIGTTQNVTADSDPGSGGMPLIPGATLLVPAETLNDLWVISTAGSQDIAWIGV